MVHVFTNFSRPPETLIRKFNEIGVATIYEASGRLGSIDPGIKPLAAGSRVLGPAFTVSCHPADNLMLHKALQLAQPGDILVADTGGYCNAGYWGGLMATSAMAFGIGGLVIDGCIRDSAEIINMGFPVFCRGTCIRGTTKSILGTINHPLVFGEVLLSPGDLVIGDDDGLVIVQQTQIEQVLEASVRRVEAEKTKADKLRQKITSVELNQLDQVFQSLGMIQE